MPPTFLPDDGIALFVTNLLVGGVTIHVAARWVIDDAPTGALDFDHAVVTALLAALAWAVLSTIPVAGAVLALVAWVGVLHWRYPGDVGETLGTALAAWAAAVLLLAALELLGVRGIGALGVPGT